MAVIDASIVIAALSPDEQDQTARTKLAPYVGGGRYVPGPRPIELANILSTKRRRAILLAADGDAVWHAIASLQVETCQFDVDRVAAHSRPLAAGSELMSHDACYLQLALDRSAPLATVDRKLAAAARAEGITGL